MKLLQNFRQKLTLRQRIGLLLMALLLLAFLIFGMTYRDSLGLTLFHRWFTYDNEKDSITFSHGARSEDLFYGLGFKLLVCSDGMLQLLSPTGEQLLREQADFANPAISANGKQAVVYDAGGQNLFVIAKDKVAFSTALSSEQYIRSASINQSGWMAVTSKEAGFRGVVSIYNPSYELTMTISLSAYYPVNAVVTPDCRGVYVLTEGQDKGVFESRLLYYTFDDEKEPLSQISLGDQVVLSMKSTVNRSWVLAENGLYTLLSSGELSAQKEFGSDYLKRASLESNDFAALLLSHSQTGNTGTLVTVDINGNVLGSLELDEQVLSIAASGRYVAVLTSNQLMIYNRDLSNLISSSDQIQGVRTLSLFSDGSVALISEELVRLYIH